MFDALRHTIAKEFLVLLRDPASRVMVIGMPVVQLLVFAFAATMEISNINIALVNQDSGRWSYEFLERVKAASFVDETISLPSLQGVEHMINTREVLLVVHIQEDFSRNIEAGKPASVQLLVDGRRANAGQIVFSYIQAIASELQLELVADSTVAVPRAEVRHWYNPNLEYRWFIVPALVTTLAFIPAISMSILSVARDRELGTLDQLVVSPVSTAEIILGKALPPVFAGLISSFIVFVLAIFAFQVPYAGNMALMFVCIVIFVFAVTGFGLSISAACNTQQQALMGMFALTVPMFITSGFVSPVENMPEMLQRFSELNPLKHALIIVQGSFLQGMRMTEIWPNVWPLLLIGLVTITLAGFILRLRIQ